MFYIRIFSMIENVENFEEQECDKIQYTKISPLQFLREQDRAHKADLKQRKRKIKKRAYLAAHIEHNDNIFQLGPDKINRKAAQNIFWEKNYKLKMAINILKQDNSSLKARIWNFEKENRKMDKQIESWNLEKLFASSRKKPYIDMATVCKVFSDQDYEIVSNKIAIAQLERVLEQKMSILEELANQTKDERRWVTHKSYKVCEKKQQLVHLMKQETMVQGGIDKMTEEFIASKLEELGRVISDETEESEIIKKKTELRRKANLSHRSELEACMKEASGYKRIDEDEIIKMRQLMRKMRLEEQESVKDMKKELKAVQNDVVGEEYRLQNMMGQFIQKKIELNHKMEELHSKIQTERKVETMIKGQTDDDQSNIEATDEQADSKNKQSV